MNTVSHYSKEVIMIFDIKKASLIKRISAYLFDLIIFCVVAVGIAVLISTIVGYDAKLNDLENSYIKYEEEYNIDLEISEDEYNKLTDEEKDRYQKASEAFADDKEVSALYSLIFSLTLVIISISILIAYLILELLIPFILKNGQTLGKKIFSIAVIRTDGVKISLFQLFVRSILGKYTIETMVPMLILMMFLMGTTGIIGAFVIVGILILQIVVIVVSKTNSPIHDLLAVTAVVDINTQMIFDSTEKMMEYKKKKAQEAAISKPY